MANTRKPTAQQSMLIKLASRKQGVTRAEVREALGYDDGANIAVQTMLKKLAARFGFRMITEETASDNSARSIAVYGFRKAAPAAALKTGRAPVRKSPR